MCFNTTVVYFDCLFCRACILIVQLFILLHVYFNTTVVYLAYCYALHLHKYFLKNFFEKKFELFKELFVFIKIII